MSMIDETAVLHERHEKASVGFWLYLMTDCVLFAGLFAVYAVLHGNTFGGPGPNTLFHSGTALAETLVLLASSYACGLAVLQLRKGNRTVTIALLALTFVLGATFLGIELSEFGDLIAGGNSFTRSGFLSSFFVLVGTHGAHISVGLLWILVMIVQLARKDITAHTIRRLTLFSLFWHFLDVVWIFIFSTVYLMGLAQ